MAETGVGKQCLTAALYSQSGDDSGAHEAPPVWLLKGHCIVKELGDDEVSVNEHAIDWLGLRNRF